MPVTMKDLGTDRPGIEDRLTLLEEIWESIAAEPGALAITEEDKRLLDRRLADLETDPSNVLSWEEIKAQVRTSPP